MRLLPSSRPVRIVLAGAVVGLVAVAVWNRQFIGDVYGYLFPGGIVDDARQRTSDPTARAEGDHPTVAPRSAPRPPGNEPAIALERRAQLVEPSAVVDPPGDGPVLVSTLDGRVHELDLDTGASTVVLDLSHRVSTGGERGLLGLTLDPSGERFYVNYTDRDGDTDIRSFTFRDGRPIVSSPSAPLHDSVLHLEVGQPYRNHNAGNLVFGPDDVLWIGLGDGGSAGDPADVAQDVDHLLGKMLRVVPDTDGGVLVPGSNPDWGGHPAIWGIGLRNPWRYSFDRATGQLWVADVGQDEIEEVTVVDPDAERVNFGWDHLEGTRPFDGRPGPELTDPVVEYTHAEGCSITGGHVYRGEAVPSLYGWYLFGDFCGGWIRAVPSDDPTRSPVELVPDAGAAISFAELEDGELLFLSRDGVWAVVER